MIESSVAQRSPVHTGQTPTADDARRSRGVAIATNHLREIKKLSPGYYSVPASKASEVYVVTVRPVEACTCEDSIQRGSVVGPCRHQHAVRYMLKKSGVCEGCGLRHWNEDLAEVEDSLTYFDGDRLCEDCLLRSDATQA